MMPLDEKDLQLLAEVLPNVSAQLRSSMANVFAAANRLAPAEAREADPMLDKNAAILTMSCHQMLRLVGTLSAASELVQGGRFRLCTGDIVGFCHALCERAEPLFALRGGALRFSASHESHVIAFNAPMLERALLNLLSNALKFTPNGGRIEVILSLREAEESVTLTVRDTGIGIPPEHQSRIFERFYRVDKSHSKASGGTGLGLSIVKHAVAYHHGTFALKSEVGKGTEITVRFPQEK